MDSVIDHKHNNTDSRKLDASEALLNAPQAAVAPVSGSAGGTYDAATITLINSLVASHNDLLLKIKALGLTL